MAKILVEKGVKIPDRVYNSRRHGREPKYPFAEMEVGDSFLYPGQKKASLSSVVSQAHRRLRAPGADVPTFAYDTEGEFKGNGEAGIRVWRII